MCILFSLRSISEGWTWRWAVVVQFREPHVMRPPENGRFRPDSQLRTQPVTQAHCMLLSALQRDPYIPLCLDDGGNSVFAQHATLLGYFLVCLLVCLTTGSKNTYVWAPRTVATITPLDSKLMTEGFTPQDRSRTNKTLWCRQRLNTPLHDLQLGFRTGSVCTFLVQIRLPWSLECCLPSIQLSSSFRTNTHVTSFGRSWDESNAKCFGIPSQLLVIVN